MKWTFHAHERTRRRTAFAAVWALCLLWGSGEAFADQHLSRCGPPFFGDAADYPDDQDPDGDGVPNGDEISAGTDAALADSDDDLLSDGEELRRTNTSQRKADHDNDRLLDGHEVFGLRGATSDPTKVDTDNDGVSDGDEVGEDGYGASGGTHPRLADTDGDGRSDGAEREATDGPATDPRRRDSDGDLLADQAEIDAGTDPNDVDTDGDGIWDGNEARFGTNPLLPDSDAGGDSDREEILRGTDPMDPDDDDLDGDGIPNGVETAAGSDPALPDSDEDGLDDGVEDANRDGVVDAGETDPTRADTDGDLLNDLEERNAGTNPRRADSDSDGLGDGAEVQTHGTDPLVGDTDGDGLLDGEEVNGVRPTDPTKADTDGGGVIDFFEVPPGLGMNPDDPADDPLRDLDADGIPDDVEGGEVAPGATPGVQDSDGDGLVDGVELTRWGTRADDADSDDDGLSDGDEVNNRGTSPTLVDSDGDGVQDGTELGLDSANPASTNLLRFVPDAHPDSTTDPTNPDSDGDGLADGTEDANFNGQHEPASGETRPDEVDTDGDGMDDAYETTYGPGTDGEGPALNPNDAADRLADPDVDGLSNLAESQVTWLGPDPDGVTFRERATPTNPRARDTDEDGLDDGVEFNAVYGGLPAGALQPDGTPWGAGLAYKTNPIDADTDGDGILDGVEDRNQDGAFNPLVTPETSPVLLESDGDGLPDAFEDRDGDGELDDGESDATRPDSDDDGLDDGLEFFAFGTGLRDDDTDGDGLLDGVEVGQSNDADPATTTDPHLDDTDGDGLADGLEDLDGDGARHDSETDAAWWDTDYDGIADGVEDADKDGSRDDDETDPRRADSDGDGLADGVEDVDLDGSVGDGETDPRLADTDRGGVNDGDERMVRRTDPLVASDDSLADSDGDGLLNCEEDRNGNGRIEWFETDPRQADSDGDGLSDAVEVAPARADGRPADTDDDGVIDAFDDDSDGDGVGDLAEAGRGAEPADTDGDQTPDFRDLDSDGDGIDDDEEEDGDGVPSADVDGDGAANRVDLDSDGDGKDDADEGTGDVDGDGIPNFVDADDADGVLGDSDADGLTNVEEEGLCTDPDIADSDSDGLLDGEELRREGDGFVAITDPCDGDSDDDGLADGAEGEGDADGDGLPNAHDPDSDDDGLLDGTEAGVDRPLPDTDVSRRRFRADTEPSTRTDPTKAATDPDAGDDGVLDPNRDGRIDADELDAAGLRTDTDRDGLTDRQEQWIGSDPRDADSDDDGIADGLEPNWAVDMDADGAPGAIDPDSDGDGLADGLESCGGSADCATEDKLVDTNLLVGNWRLDADPATVTHMLLADTDGDGLADGVEDVDRNGRVDDGESDPADVASALDPAQIADTDADGLPDLAEVAVGLLTEDADSDDDGVLDGEEPNATFDSDGDGWIDALDPDSDGDGLFDGTELGVSRAGVHTLSDSRFFVPDADAGATITSPVNRDTDGGGATDGNEDLNHDGAVDEGEGDPNSLDNESRFGRDFDPDGDGLITRVEERYGLQPNDADSDDDGVLDGQEVDWRVDTDGDGRINALDADSDADGLIDGTERGVDEAHPDTDIRRARFVADADPLTTTFMVRADSDGGGTLDGLEDHDGDGAVGDGETDPLDPADDAAVDDDLDGDGLDNDTELALGTLPGNPDSDGDGIGDLLEVGDPGRPFDTDEDGDIDALDRDSDGDDVPDAEEAGDPDVDDPWPRDTDGDGEPDFRDIDSDGDQVFDFEEGTEYPTDRLLADTDGGGAPDGIEIFVNQTDPTDPSDDFIGRLKEGEYLQGGLVCQAGRGGGAAGSLAVLLIASALALALRRRRVGLLSCALGGLVLGAVGLGPQPAHAADAFNPVSLQMQPTNNGIITTEAGELINHLDVTASLLTLGSEGLITVARDGEHQRDVLTRRIEMHAQAALGLFEWGEVRLLVPFTVYQDGTEPGQNSPSVGVAGLGDVQIGGKVRLLRPQTEGLQVAFLAHLGLPTGDDENYFGHGGLSVNYGAAVSWRFRDWLVAGNAGAVFVPDRKVTTLEVGDAIYLSGGGRWQPLDYRFGAAAELRGELPTKGWPLVQSQRNMEMLASFNVRALWNTRVEVGAAAGLLPGYRTSLIRYFAKIHWQSGADAPGEGDQDDDGIVDARDLCPDEPEDADGFQDADGCPDADNDGDGIPDVSDRCPNRREDFNGREDGDGCPETDADGDGVPDDSDECPQEVEDVDGFEDGDGCPDTDNDGDGIADETDQCPLDPETRNGVLDEDGCPDEAKVVVNYEGLRIDLADPIRFRPGGYTVLPESVAVLDQVAEVIRSNERILRVGIVAHVPASGDARSDRILSEERARSVERYLRNHGVSKGRLETRGAGASEPVVPADHAEAIWRNARVEFLLVEVEPEFE